MLTHIHKIVQSTPRVALVLLVLGFIAYGEMLTGPFKTLDDEVSIVYNEQIKDVRFLGDLFRQPFFEDSPYYRPLVHVSYMAQYYLFGMNPLYFNVINLVTHILNSLLVFCVFSAVMNTRVIPFFAAALFLIHPIQAEAVSNIAGHSIVLCTLFMLLTIWLYIKYAQYKGSFFYWLSFVPAAAALWTKESAVILPLLLFAYEWVYLKKSSLANRLKFALGRVSLHGLLAVVYLLFRRTLDLPGVRPWWDLEAGLLGVTTFLRGLGTYARLIALPVDLYFDRTIEYFASFHDGEARLTLAVAACALVVVFKTWKSLSLAVRFSLGWTAISFLSVSQIIPIRTYANHAALPEHFVYLPAVGIMLCVAQGFTTAAQFCSQKRLVSSSVIRLTAAGFLAFFAVMTVEQSLYSHKQVALYKESLSHNPDNIRINNAYALSLIRNGHLEEAGAAYRRSLALDPGDVNARIGLGVVLCDLGYYLEGIEEYERVTTPGKYAPILKGNLKLAYTIVLKKYLAWLEQEPRNARFHYSIGIMYAKIDEVDNARAHYLDALSINPDYQEAIYNLALLYAGEGRDKDAAHYLRRYMALADEGNELYEHAQNLLRQLNTP